jgi:cytidylate kinase
MSLESAQVKVAGINKERRNFLWKMFHVHHDDPSTFDLMINTDRLEDYHAVADLILTAMAAMGFELPELHGEKGDASGC